MHATQRLAIAALAAAASLLQASPAGAQANPSFVLANRSAAAVTGAFAAPAGSSAWGPSRLGAPLPPGASVPVRLPIGDCSWDVRVTFDGAPAEERRGVNLCEATDLAVGSGAEPQGPPNPSFTLVNAGPRPVAELFVSPSNHPNWGQNRLGRAQVQPNGGTFPVRLPSGDCVYDVRAVFADGAAAERRAVDACSLSSVTVP